MRYLLALLLLLPTFASAQMISQLPPISSVAAADYTIMVVPGSPNTDYRATIAQIFTDPTVTGGMSVTGGLVTDTITIGGVPFVPGGGGGGTTGSSLTITGNGTIGGTFGVTGNTSLSAMLGVVGNATLQGTLTVAGATELSTTTIGGNLGVTGTVTTTGTVSVTGNFGASGNGTIGGTLGVGNGLNVTGTVAASGLASLLGGTVTTLTGTSSINISGPITTSGTITTSGVVNAIGYQAGGTGGASCAGAPSGAFNVSVGIVTHC